MGNAPVVELRGITKRFGSVVANDDVSLEVHAHEILSVLGENGSGKTTLMNILSGIYRPDEGQIFVNGQEVRICSPRDALSLKIGMIHQHYRLVNLFTAAENIILGLDSEKSVLDMNGIKRKIRGIIDSFGFDLDLDKKVYEMSVSQKQTIEIIKALYRGADVLILDEPTAVLTPQETEKLFTVLRNMKASGKAIIIITHKLQEVLEVSDRVTVLRRGKNAGSLVTSESDIPTLVEKMVGERVSLDIARTPPVNPSPRLKVEKVSCRNSDGHYSLHDVSFTANSGEILGVAGIAGGGMKELLEAIAGIQPVKSGSIAYCDGETETELVGKKPFLIRRLGVALSFVPEDRLGMGLVGSMGITDNVMLRGYEAGGSPFVDRESPQRKAEEIIEMLQISAPDTDTPVRRLSGGNVQKVLVGREISSNPTVLMVAYPVRGLDINSSYTIYNLLSEQKRKGVAVICVIEDLDVLLELCDRILVLNNGRVTGNLDASAVTKDEIGLLMTSASAAKTH